MPTAATDSRKALKVPLSISLLGEHGVIGKNCIDVIIDDTLP